MWPRQRPRYLAATRREKRRLLDGLLDEVVTVTGSHRKATLGRLHRSTPRAARTGRPRVYGPDVTLGVLHAMPATAVLRRVSVATLKRLLAPIRATRLPRGRGMTCAGTWLKHQIPIRTFAECRRATTGRRGRHAPCPGRASQ